MPQAIQIDTAAGPQRLNTMLRVVSPDKVITEEKAAAEKRKAEHELNSDEPVNALVDHLRGLWQAAYQAKHDGEDPIQDRLLKCLRQRLGQYDPDKIADIRKFGGSEVYFPLTNTVCRSCEAWIKDVMLPAGERPWDIEPTPLVDLPDSDEQTIDRLVYSQALTIMQAYGPQAIDPEMLRDLFLKARDVMQKERFEKARTATNFQARKIEDEFQEGGFYTALADFISDLSTFPSAFMEGPVIRRERVLSWTPHPKGGFIPQITPKLLRLYFRISPFDVYPGPNAKHIQDGYLFIRRRLRRSQLFAMIGVPGFSERMIRAVLDEYGNTGLQQWLFGDQEQADIQNRPDEMTSPDKTIDAVQFWGAIQGDKLREWGLSEKDIPDPQKEYKVTTWLVDRWVICARLNPHPLGKRPYYSSSYEYIVDSIWGKSPPELMRADQETSNAACRHAINNLAIASGPQVEINMDRVAPGEDVENVYPFKIWKTESDPTGAPGHAIQFYQPNPMTDTLLKVAEQFELKASDHTGIPKYIYGQDRDVGGAGETASGLSMLMNAAGKVLRGVIKILDENVIKKVVREHWMHIMLYDEDEYKVGDINIVARASEHLIIEELLQLRRTEFLNATNNPLDAPIIGLAGRAAILRAQSKGLRLGDDIVPPKEEMEAREQAMTGVPPEQGGGGLPQQAIQLNPAGQRSGEMTRPAT